MARRARVASGIRSDSSHKFAALNLLWRQTQGRRLGLTMSTRKEVRNDDDFEDDAYDVAESTLLAPTHSDSDDGDSVVEESSDGEDEDEGGVEDDEGSTVLIRASDEEVHKNNLPNTEPSKKRQRVEAMKKARGLNASSPSSSSILTDANSMLNVVLKNEPEGPYDSISSLLSAHNFISSLSNTEEFSQLHIRAFSSVFPSLKKALRLENIEEAGSPKAIVICSSAARATEVIKEISKVFKVKVAKLYAKHFKVGLGR